MAELKLGYLNYVALIGRVVQDPDLRYTPRGTPVCTLRIAVSRRYKDPNTGEWKDDANFFNVVAFKRSAELCGDYLKKGSAVLVEGRLRSRSWETNTGERRHTVEIRAFRVQFLDRTIPGAEAEELLPEEEVAESSEPVDLSDEG